MPLLKLKKKKKKTHKMVSFCSSTKTLLPLPHVLSHCRFASHCIVVVLRKRVSIFSNPGIETPVLAQSRRTRTTTGGRAWSHGSGLLALPHHPPLQAVNSHRPTRPRTGTGRAGFHRKF
jgi:hypothetical protein